MDLEPIQTDSNPFLPLSPRVTMVPPHGPPPHPGEPVGDPTVASRTTKKLARPPERSPVPGPGELAPPTEPIRMIAPVDDAAPAGGPPAPEGDPGPTGKVPRKFLKGGKP